MLNKKIKAFTISELLIVMALTSAMITFAYTGLRYINKLLQLYNTQSSFITELSELNKRITSLHTFKNMILPEEEGKYVYKSDSAVSFLEFHQNFILVIKNNVADTFHLRAQNLQQEYESVNNPNWKNRLIKRFEFDVVFEKQKFHLLFNKDYDAFTKLFLEKEGNK